MGRLIIEDYVDVKIDGSKVGSEIGINFIPGKNISITAKDDPDNNDVDLTIEAIMPEVGHEHTNLVTLANINQELGRDAAPSFASLEVRGDLISGGTVDGVDVAKHAGDAAIHHLHANKVDVDRINQDLSSSGAPNFKGLTIKGDIQVDGFVDGVDVSTHAGDASIHHSHNNTHQLEAIDQALGTGNSPTFTGLAIQGNIEVQGSVDGVDISAHGSRHASGGPDVITGDLDANARVQVEINGTAAGTRRKINFVAGNNISVTANDNPEEETVNIALSAARGIAGYTGLIEKVESCKLLPEDLNKIILCTNSTEIQLLLPTGYEVKIGDVLKIIKSTKERIQINTADVDQINNSSLGGYVYNDNFLEEWDATIEIMYVTENRWVVVQKIGTWYIV